MKDWKLLTDEELAALTDKEVEFYTKLLYAQNGVKMLDIPEEPKVIKEPYDLRVYYIKGVTDYFGNNMVFIDLKEAEKIVDILKQCKTLGHNDYEVNVGSENKYFEAGLSLKDNDCFAIIPKDVYSKAKYLEIKNSVVEYENAKKKYKADREEYDKNHAKAIEVTQEFFFKLNGARDRMARRKELVVKFYNDYMPLAENAYRVAMGFLKKAYDISEDDEAYIKNNAPQTQNKEEDV